MIFVDTSVWIEYFREKDPSVHGVLNGMLDDSSVALAVPVWVELLTGMSRKDAKTLRPLLAALPRFYPKRSTWNTIGRWIEKATRAGHRFGMADLLIAAIAAENDSKLWTLDQDFARMADLKLLQLY